MDEQIARLVKNYQELHAQLREKDAKIAQLEQDIATITAYLISRSRPLFPQ